MRRAHTLIAGAVLACGAIVAAPAAAQPSFEVEQMCWDEGEEFSPEQGIAACTALLDGDELSDEDRPYILAMRGWSYHEQGDLDRALADYSEKIRLQPDLADGYGWRAAVYLQQEDYDKALADYSQAISLGPEETDIAVWYHDRGFARFSLGDHQSAIADYTQAINRASDDPNNWNSRCWARAVWGRQLVEALDDCNEALAIDPGAYYAWDSRGLVQLRRQDWDAALADYQGSLDLEPNASAHFGRGIALMRLGNADEAEADFATAAQLDPTIAQTYAGFGITP